MLAMDRYQRIWKDPDRSGGTDRSGLVPARIVTPLPSYDDNTIKMLHKGAVTYNMYGLEDSISVQNTQNRIWVN